MAANGVGNGKRSMDVRRSVNLCLTKLSDRDTEAMAASELDSMARSLPADSLLPFLSAISDTRPSDRTPLRRHCVRLLSLISHSHPPHSLAPLLPRMLSAVLRRLRDPDSSVRSACVDAVRSMAAASSRSSFSSVFLRPLLESLLLEQDHHAQMASTMCLAAAIDSAASADLAPHLQRLVPRLVKLARSDAFKAKPALLSLIGTVVAAGGASSSTALGLLIPCLVEMLSSEDWATRKAAAEALSRVASLSDTHLLVTFKSCISSCEARRFDKVKTVRETMNQMLQAWKDLPDSVAIEGQPTNHAAAGSQSQNNDNAPSSSSPSRRESGTSSIRSNSHNLTRKTKQPSSRSPPEASPAADEKRRRSPPLFRKLDRNKKPSGWRLEVAVPERHPEDISPVGRKKDELNLFGNDSKDKATGTAELDVAAQELSHQKRGSLGSNSMDGVHENRKENREMCFIREQLAQIENQQSNLMGLLQSFIGGTQSSVHSLETRVHNLELSLADLSHDMAVSLGRMSTACWRLPGADFLSCRFWRTERRPPFGNRSGLVVNPLAETDFHRRTNLGTIQDGRHFDMASSSAHVSAIRKTNRCTHH